MIAPRDIGRAYDHATAVAARQLEDDADVCAVCGLSACAGQCEEPTDMEPLFEWEISA